MKAWVLRFQACLAELSPEEIALLLTVGLVLGVFPIMGCSPLLDCVSIGPRCNC